MNISAIEPLMPEEKHQAALAEASSEVLAKSRALSSSLPPHVADQIGDLVRNMNCYYSNLIEGHDTHPRDIDRALSNDFSKEPEKRALQLEAKAHIELQLKIDRGERVFETSAKYIQWLHQLFCESLPEQLLWSAHPDGDKKTAIVPGAFRDRLVQVGQHVPPDAEDIPKFLKRFHEVYNPEKLNVLKNIIAVAASHHRLLWIHPFLDGNGRVTRLFSHAYLRHIGVGSSLWSISRGLARHVSIYRSALMNADQTRQGDLDGRGNLSQKGLIHFCQFFLKTALDQIEFMETLIKPEELLKRIERYVNEEQARGNLPNASFSLLREAFYESYIDRGKAPLITGFKERQARTVLNTLVEKKLLVSDTPKSPVRLNIPLDVVEYWFPRLYPIG